MYHIIIWQYSHQEKAQVEIFRTKKDCDKYFTHSIENKKEFIKLGKYNISGKTLTQELNRKSFVNPQFH